MGKLGHIGMTVQLVEHEGKLMILCWSPRPGMMEAGMMPALLKELEEDMTENELDWRYWQNRPLQPKGE